MKEREEFLKIIGEDYKGLQIHLIRPKKEYEDLQVNDTIYQNGQKLRVLYVADSTLPTPEKIK